MIPEQRRARIVELLAAAQQTSVNHLAETLGVSRETVRRDLSRLEESGYLRKVHGGAVPVQTGSEPILKLRAAQQRIEKLLIGECAAALLTAGDSLFVDAGTTTDALSVALARCNGLTIITNSLAVADRIGAGPGENKVFLLGGDFCAEALKTVGPVTIEQIEGFRADHAVLTIGAIDEGGALSDFNLEEATVARAMIRQARDVTIIADHTKFGRSALARVCALRELRRIVTDTKPKDAMCRAIEKAEVELIIAGAGATRTSPAGIRRSQRKAEEVGAK